MIKKYATFAVSGYWQVAVCTAVLGWTMLFLPLGGVLSAATLGLFALQFGMQRAAVALALSMTFLFILLFLTNQFLPVDSEQINIERSVFLLFFQWMPIILIVLLQLKTNSLSLVFQVLSGFLIVLVLVMEWFVADSAVLWSQVLNQITNGELQRVLADNPDLGPQYEAMLSLMTGFMSSSMLIVWVSSLLLANWLQSLVNAPGTFVKMFTSIKLGKVISGLGLVLFATTALAKSSLAGQLAMVIVTVAIFQGIATIHFLLKRVENGKVFLGLFYGALVLSPWLPLLPGLVGISGMLESFINLRDKSIANISK